MSYRQHLMHDMHACSPIRQQSVCVSVCVWVGVDVCACVCVCARRQEDDDKVTVDKCDADALEREFCCCYPAELKDCANFAVEICTHTHTRQTHGRIV